MLTFFPKGVGRGEIDVMFYFHFLNYRFCGIFIFQHEIIVLGSRIRGRGNEDIKNKKEIELLPYTHMKKKRLRERENLVSYAQKI